MALEEISVIHESVNPLNDEDEKRQKIEANFDSKKREDLTSQRDFINAVNKPYIPVEIRNLRLSIISIGVLWFVFLLYSIIATDIGFKSICDVITEQAQSEILLVNLFHIAQESLRISAEGPNNSQLKRFAMKIYSEKNNIERSCYNRYCSENVLVIEGIQSKTLSLVHALNNLIFKCFEAENNQDNESYINSNIIQLIDSQRMISQTGPDLIKAYDQLRLNSIVVACIFSILILILISGVNIMGMKCYRYFFSTVELILTPSIEVRGKFNFYYYRKIKYIKKKKIFLIALVNNKISMLINENKLEDF